MLILKPCFLKKKLIKDLKLDSFVGILMECFVNLLICLVSTSVHYHTNRAGMEKEIRLSRFQMVLSIASRLVENFARRTRLCWTIFRSIPPFNINLFATDIILQIISVRNTRIWFNICPYIFCPYIGNFYTPKIGVVSVPCRVRQLLNKR